MEFEIKRKDFAGRIGKLEIGRSVVETPTILPVINPNLQTINVDELKEMGAQIVITNSYIIFKNLELREKALSRGLHDLIGFDGPIMTDSGAYQLSVYGDVDVSSEEIIDFQKKIGSDIIVPLDIPTPQEASKEKARKDLEETNKRLRQIELDERNFAGPVQGSSFFDLRERSAKEVSDLGFDLYCIGGVVPMMESYDFSELAKSIVASKKNLSLKSPIHLFGAGHPMTFALATLLGCDLFDSAAYALFAKRDKYLTNRGTWDMNEMNYLPCSCPICQKNNINDLLENKTKLAKHNLYSTFEEIKTIKEAIRRGELFELAFERSRTHPELIDGLKIAMGKGKEFFEKITPRSKKNAFFYQGEESLYRPEIKRNLKRLLDMDFEEQTLLISQEDFEIEEKQGVAVFKVKPPFVFPKELKRTYPFGQSIIADLNNEKRLDISKKLIKDFLENEKDEFEEIKTVGEFRIKEIEKIEREEARDNYSKNHG
ncbi:tRNA guanosine(15) transglycosylase TgtA [archaeon SCG-AAA382B04]|nr:tRNA guanosine(15) transglycosylase TgtA [archaeon SCG-AAA382B04]